MKSKLYTSLLLLLLSLTCQAQLKLADKDFNNLLALGELYTSGSSTYTKTADSLRTPALNNIIETLLAIKKGDTTLLQHRFLKRPNNDELKIWYALREMQYNKTSEIKSGLSAKEVALKTLAADINELWLLDNYYYRLGSGMGMMFNEADLRNRNIDINTLDLKNNAERSVAYLNISSALLHGRLRVLRYMKNNDRLNTFISRMPSFNGKPYYYFTDISKDDFEWIGYEKKESYNTRHIGNFIEMLIGHMLTKSELNDITSARDVYNNSILSEPEYFKYSNQSKMLQDVYDKSAKANNSKN